MNDLHVSANSDSYLEQESHSPSAQKVLVAVPTLNEADHIADCLASLFADPWMSKVRVVVADGGSKDETRNIVRGLQKRYPSLQLIENPKRLQSAAINAVADECATDETEILVRCDAHAVYPEGYVRAIATSLEARPDAASVVTPMDARGSECFQSAAAWVVDTPLGSGGSAHRGGQRSAWVDHGHHAGFRLDWFRRIGGYDESFSHNEDAEFDFRLAQAGGRIWLDAEVRMDYRMRSTPQALARQYWNYGQGRARTLYKHRMRPRLRQIIPVLNLIFQTLAVLLIPFFPIAALLPASYVFALAAVSVFGVLRLHSLCGIWAGAALFIMHMAWGAGFVVRFFRHL